MKMNGPQSSSWVCTTSHKYVFYDKKRRSILRIIFVWRKWFLHRFKNSSDMFTFSMLGMGVMGGKYSSLPPVYNSEGSSCAWSCDIFYGTYLSRMENRVWRSKTKGIVKRKNRNMYSSSYRSRNCSDKRFPWFDFDNKDAGNKIAPNPLE